MKIVLNAFRHSTYPDLGILYLSAVITKHDPTWAVVVEHNASITTLLQHKPDVVGLSFTSADFTKAKRMAQSLIKQGVRVIGGGAHLSSSPETLPKEMCAGMCGEGEEYIVQLIESVLFNTTKLQDIPGAIYHTASGVVTTPPNLIKNIDAIPHPARHLVPKSFWSTGVTSLLTSRGCKYRCSFCQVSTVWRYPRMHSAEYVCNEIEQVHKQFGIHTFGVVDDLFISDLPRIADIISGLDSRGLLGKVGFAVNGRSNLITPELCDLLKKMGVREVALGLESMSPRILPLLKDRATVEDNRRAVDTLYNAGLKAGGLFMIGTPTETEEDMAETYQYVYDNRHKFGGLQICITTPMPNTKLWDFCANIGKTPKVVKDGDWDRMNIAAENINTNLYVGDVEPGRFNNILHQFRTLFFEGKDKAQPTLSTRDTFGTVLPWQSCSVSGLHPDGWTTGDLLIQSINTVVLKGTTLTITLRSLSPIKPWIVVRINGMEQDCVVTDRDIKLKIENTTAIDSLHIQSDTFVPSAYGINNDSRVLGLNIKSITTDTAPIQKVDHYV